MVERHAAPLFAAVKASRAELLPWMPWAREPKLNLEMAMQSERAWLDDEHYHFALVEKSTGDVLGVAGLNREAPGTAELHYWIRSDRAGRGLTTEAGRAVVDWARDALRLDRLTLWAGTENAASRRVAAKLGFAHVGPLPWRPEGGLGDFAAESYELELRPLPPPPRAE